MAQRWYQEDWAGAMAAHADAPICGAPVRLQVRAEIARLPALRRQGCPLEGRLWQLADATLPALSLHGRLRLSGRTLEYQLSGPHGAHLRGYRQLQLHGFPPRFTVMLAEFAMDGRAQRRATLRYDVRSHARQLLATLVQSLRR